jgi:hypothetical protein
MDPSGIFIIFILDEDDDSGYLRNSLIIDEQIIISGQRVG